MGGMWPLVGRHPGSMTQLPWQLPWQVLWQQLSTASCRQRQPSWIAWPRKGEPHRLTAWLTVLALPLALLASLGFASQQKPVHGLLSMPANAQGPPS